MRKIQGFQKPVSPSPVVNKLTDISSNALSQMVGYFQQFQPQLVGRSVDGAASIDIYQDGVYVGTVSSLNFTTATATPDPNAGSENATDGGSAEGGVGTGGHGGGVGLS